MAKRDPKRLLIQRLRRTVRVETRFDVVDLGEGREQQTCRDCSTSIVINHCPVLSLSMAARLIAYRTKGGIWGHCPTCSKRRAAEKYPYAEERK